jgi:hypothetical protein
MHDTDAGRSKLWNEASSRQEEVIVRGDWLDRKAEASSS